MMEYLSLLFFFFQAEDGIRDVAVTGVQTCALPISVPGFSRRAPPFEKSHAVDRVRVSSARIGRPGARPGADHVHHSPASVGAARFPHDLDCDQRIRTSGIRGLPEWMAATPAGALDQYFGGAQCSPRPSALQLRLLFPVLGSMDGDARSLLRSEVPTKPRAAPGFLVAQLEQHRLIVRGVGRAVHDHVLDAVGEILRHENEIAGKRRSGPLLLVVYADRRRVRLAWVTHLPRVAVGGNPGRERRLQAPVQRILRWEIEIRGEDARSGAR